MLGEKPTRHLEPAKTRVAPVELAIERAANDAVRIGGGTQGVDVLLCDFHIDVLEHQHIERTLRYHGGNRTRAAKELGISRATLINKIKLYAITD